MKVSAKRIRKTTEELCQFKNRIAGTKTEKEAANYLKGLLSDIGYDIIEHEFPIIAWEPQESTINLILPEKKPVHCALFPNSPSVKHRVTLVDLESDQEGPISKLVKYGLAEWGESLYTSPEIPYNKAIDRGLDGLIISSPDAGELFKVRVGNHGKALQIPIISVSKETGELLKKMMEDSEVVLDVTCKTKRFPSKSRNLEIILKGNNPDFDIIVSAHYDAWFSGAADNTAPVAIAIELAQQLHEYVQQGGTLRRSVRLILFGAEEGGSERPLYWLNGSRSYVESQKTLEQIALVVNLDSIGYDATNYVGTTCDLSRFSKTISTEMNEEGRFNHYCPPADGSDHWFFTISGVPTIYLISWPSPLYHTQKDLPENLDFESIEVYAEYALRTVIEFSNNEVLLIDVMTLLESISERVNEFRKSAENLFGLQEVSDLVTRILEYKTPLERYSQCTLENKNNNNIAKLNKFLLATARKINRTIGVVGGVHEARYLSCLELIQEYITINDFLTKIEAEPFMKIHPRTLASLRLCEDGRNKLVDIISVIIDLRKECNRLAFQINEEISLMIHYLKEIQEKIEVLLT